VTHAPVDTGLRTLPYRWYTDPRVAEIERDRIFRGTWHYAGHLRLEMGPTRLSQVAPVHPRAVASREPCDVRGEIDLSQFHILLPAMKFNVSPGRPNLSIGPLWPVAPDRCTGFLDCFFAAGVSDEWLAEFTAWDFQVGAEDVALVEGVQAGAASGALADGRLLEVTEGLIAAFQAYVRARVEPEL